jgi:hypothetical protein
MFHFFFRNIFLEVESNLSQMSKLSTTSCSPAEIKNRVKAQVAAAKKRERSRLLRKGETAKYTCNRRELANQIKEDFFD